MNRLKTVRELNAGKVKTSVIKTEEQRKAEYQAYRDRIKFWAHTPCMKI